MIEAVTIIPDAEGDPSLALLNLETYNTFLLSMLEQDTIQQRFAVMLGDEIARTKAEIAIDDLSTYIKQNDLKPSSA